MLAIARNLGTPSQAHQRLAETLRSLWSAQSPLDVAPLFDRWRSCTVPPAARITRYVLQLATSPVGASAGEAEGWVNEQRAAAWPLLVLCLRLDDSSDRFAVETALHRDIPDDAFDAVVDVVVHRPTIRSWTGHEGITRYHHDLTGAYLLRDRLNIPARRAPIVDALGSERVNMYAACAALEPYLSEDDVFEAIWKQRERVDVITLMKASEHEYPNKAERLIPYLREILRAGHHTGAGLGDTRKVLVEHLRTKRT